MSKIFDDIKLQYKIGDITNKIIYWNVGMFLLSLVLFLSLEIIILIIHTG